MTIAQNSPFDSLHFKSQKKFGFGQDLNNLQMKEKQRVDNTYRPNSIMKEGGIGFQYFLPYPQ